MATMVKQYKDGSFYIKCDYTGHTYPCTAARLTDVCKHQRLGLVVTRSKSPRLATITKRNGKAITTDRLWCKLACLQEAASIIHKLQHLNRGGKIRYYKQLGF